MEEMIIKIFYIYSKSKTSEFYIIVNKEVTSITETACFGVTLFFSLCKCLPDIAFTWFICRIFKFHEERVPIIPNVEAGAGVIRDSERF